MKFLKKKIEEEQALQQAQQPVVPAAQQPVVPAAQQPVVPEAVEAVEAAAAAAEAAAAEAAAASAVETAAAQQPVEPVQQHSSSVTDKPLSSLGAPEESQGFAKEAADEVASSDANEESAANHSSRGKQRAKQGTTKLVYAVGQQVDAKHLAQKVGSFAAKWYPGVVRKAHGDGACDIDYDDGDQEDKVPLKFIRAPRKLEAQQPVVPEALSVGDAVDGHYGTDEDELWWPATVTRLRANGSVDVRYDDGDVEEQKPRSRLRSQPLRGAEAAKAATEGEGGGGGGGSGTEIPSSSDA